MLDFWKQDIDVHVTEEIELKMVEAESIEDTLIHIIAFL